MAVTTDATDDTSKEATMRARTMRATSELDAWYGAEECPRCGGALIVAWGEAGGRDVLMCANAVRMQRSSCDLILYRAAATRQNAPGGEETA